MDRITRRFAILGAAAAAGGATALAGCAEPPPPANPIQAAFPAIGKSWTLRVYARDRVNDLRLTAVSTTFRDKPAYGIQYPAGVMTLHDPQTFNRLGQMSGRQVVESVDPDDGSFAWPLWTGKSWSSSFTLSRAQNPPIYQTLYHKVAATELVIVPAGSFLALRIDLAPGTGSDPGSRSSTWYAPSVGMVVKTAFARSAQAALGTIDGTLELVTTPA